MFENVAGCVLLIISLRYLFKLLDTNEPKYFLLSGLFLGLSLFIRPEHVLFFIPLFILFLWNRKKIKKTYMVLSALSAAIALGPFFILNNELYGSYLMTGQHIIYQWATTIPIRKFSMTNLFENSFNFINLTPLLFLCGLLGLLYCIKKRIRLQYMVLLIVSLLVLSFYFLSGRTLPTDIHSSYVRYLLPVYMLSLSLISYLIISFREKFVGILLILVMIMINIFTVLPLIKNNLENVEYYARLSSQVASVTEPDAVIFLDYCDKAIFPERRVGLVRELPEENRCELLSEIAIRLSERNVPVYLLVSKEFEQLIDYETLVKELSVRKYGLTKTWFETLYELEKL